MQNETTETRKWASRREEQPIMKIGTKSILYGVHCFFLHPWFVAASWLRLYGLRFVRCKSTGVTTWFFDPFLWICFFVHDLGYFGKPNMDGEEGESHPVLGARIIGWFAGLLGQDSRERWYAFCLYHSRFLARRDGHEPSLLCWADKYAIAITPSWIYLPMAKATGELQEYMHINTREIRGLDKSPLEWHTQARSYCRSLALEHKDGRPDTWTPKQ